MSEHHHHHGHHHDDKKRPREEAHKAAGEVSGHKSEQHDGAAAKKTRTAEVSSAVEGSKWAQLTGSTTVGDLVHHRITTRPRPTKPEEARDQHLVAIEGDFTVGAAMGLLARHDLLSAPVIDPRSRRFLGFVDVLDITGYILASYSAHSDDTNFLKKELLNEEVSHILNFSRCDDRVVIEESKTLKDLIHLFCAPRFKHRLHRVAVTASPTSPDEAPSVTNVASLSDVVALAVSQPDLLPPEKAKATVGALKLVKPIIGVRMDSAVVDALDILFHNKVSGIALIDHSGRVTGNLSASDLRGLKPESFKYFEGSVLQFFVKGLPRVATGHERGPGRAPVTCTAEATLLECMELMVKEQIHRVYVVDNLDSLHIYGVVSMSDLIHHLK
ncbi:CBS domain containing protein [Acanthamoeba castellanii str. Neff]|uniref:CBS domain containing protein n=1 Tax=Acanthamoeba castellanii (strain ATCC 30010 / Neff) TaxID=1257118 RepID=L8GL09_ACACF|nr:CBS domain containing protein [Acanthamoeba castellanii str. Neff]ELR13702.1 CBS domain containing protein [Acanthamoeba castellanii str. Neff]